MSGHVWEEYGSEDLRAKPADPNIKEPADGGRGYYRNISLLSVWTHAPFMHNNAIGPELCGGLQDEHYHSPYVDRDDRPIANPPACRPFDPSVSGRYDLYKASMKELLYPNTRAPKITMFQSGGAHQALPQAARRRTGSLHRWHDHLPRRDTLVADWQLPAQGVDQRSRPVKIDFAKLKAKYVARYGPEKGAKVAATVQDTTARLLTDPKQLASAGFPWTPSST